MTDKELARIKGDFRLFLKLVWDHINLPDPTPLQYDIARYIQKGPKKKCIEAFRGVGKSFITSAYVLWYLLNDPQRKVLVVSASKARADAFSTFTLRLIEEMPILAHLRPLPHQRQSRVEFDVGPATADQSPSVKSAGITGQITGSRADLIVADDVEVPNNSATVDMREKLMERIQEFSAILKPLAHAEIMYLGTPQTEDSIYTKLPSTFETRIWPARIPQEGDMEKYKGNLAPYILTLAKTLKQGEPCDPQRFSDWDLAEREAEYTRAGFALQFMLNTQLSDMERYPLKIKDFIVMDTDPDQAPMVVNWLPNDTTYQKQLPNLAMAGDKWYGPAGHSQEFSKYTGCVMSIDPSGRGKDETAYCVLKMLNGYLYIRRLGGFIGGYESATLRSLATIAKEEGVNHVLPESNFGNGMFTELIKPVFAEIHPCSIEEVKSVGQKEKRIIDTIEPLLNRHKLIIDRMVVEDDYRTAQKYEGENKFTKSLVYQLSRITQDKGALKHDDRLDALAIACGYWVEKVGQNELIGLARKKDDILKAELEKHMKAAKSQLVGKGAWKPRARPSATMSGVNRFR
jgi:hypothetical protein